MGWACTLNITWQLPRHWFSFLIFIVLVITFTKQKMHAEQNNNNNNKQRGRQNGQTRSDNTDNNIIEQCHNSVCELSVFKYVWLYVRVAVTCF